MLSNLTIKITGLVADGLKVAGIVALPEGETIKFGEVRFVYVVMARDSEVEHPSCKISQKLTFTITEIDVDTEDEIGSYEEDYSVQDVQLQTSDFMKPEILPSGQFKDYWESLGSNTKVAEIVQTYQLPFKSMEDAVEGVTRQFGMAVCDKSNVVNVTDKVHNLLLCGQFFGKDMVMIRAIIGFN